MSKRGGKVDEWHYYNIYYLCNTNNHCANHEGGEKMNANTKGILLVKSDRINKRIDDYEQYFLNLEKIKDLNEIKKDDFDDFVKTVKLIVSNELNLKGAERTWKA